MQSLKNNTMTALVGLAIIVAIITSFITSFVVISFSQPGTPVPTTEITFSLDAYFSGYVGTSANIASETNPDLIVPVNTKITINLTSKDMVHDFIVDDYYTNVEGSSVAPDSPNYPASIVFSFVMDKDGTYTYYCSIPGHFQSMHGNIIVGGTPVDKPGPAKTTTVNSIIRNPTDILGPVGARTAKDIEFTIVTEEVIAEIEDGTTLNYWTFNGSVPGPLLRVRQYDNVTIHLVNPASSEHTHSIDLHAVTDLGGGAAYTQTAPGETKSFSFNATHQGVFVYHCASPHVPTHISLGMYGAISVEPTTGLPTVDKEFYVGQSEIYTKWPAGIAGHQEFDSEALLLEEPTYVVFNGYRFGLTNPLNSLNASKDDNIRIFFAVGGPNIASNFHIIGEIMDKVYYETSNSTPNMVDAETVVVPPGSALMIEMNVEKVGKYILVDHALSRAFDKGALGYLYVN